MVIRSNMKLLKRQGYARSNFDVLRRECWRPEERFEELPTQGMLRFTKRPTEGACYGEAWRAGTIMIL